MARRIRRSPKNQPTTIRGLCMYCQTLLTVPTGVQEWTTCPTCARRYRHEPEPGDAEAVKCYPSVAEEAELRAWAEKLQEIKDNPADYVPCWRDDCTKGMKTMEHGKLSFVLGPCEECDGLGNLPRP